MIDEQNEYILFLVYTEEKRKITNEEDEEEEEEELRRKVCLYVDQTTRHTDKHARAMIISMSSQGKYFIEEWEWSEKGSIAVLFEWSKQTEMSNEEE